MKYFEEPELRIVVFAVEDIITTSGGGITSPTSPAAPTSGDNMGDWA